MTRKLDDIKLRQLADGIAVGLSCREIAARLGVSAATAIRWTKRCGLTSRRSRRLTPERRAELLHALRGGAAPAKAAARFGVSARTVLRHAGENVASQWRESQRSQLFAGLRSGMALRDAAAQAGVSASTAWRWARRAGVRVAAPARRVLADNERNATVAMEAGMSAEAAASAFALSETTVARLSRRPRLAPERLARRRRLFAALASGLSCRKAAALLEMPIATAIRWARESGAGTPEA